MLVHMISATSASIHDSLVPYRHSSFIVCIFLLLITFILLFIIYDIFYDIWVHFFNKFTYTTINYLFHFIYI